MIEALSLRIRLVLFLAGVLMIVHIFNVQSGGALNQLGIIPRSSAHWYHVLTAPFIHASYPHLFNNLLGLGIFSALCLLRSVRFFLSCSLFVIVVSGALVWMFGRSASHIGASGWIFGLWSLSIAVAWFDRRPLNILIAVLVVFLYGGMIYGVLPNDPQVSFEMHLFGALAGVLCAFSYATLNRHHKGER